jgi:hypothetical protein
MARNLTLQVLRGAKAHIPALALGELYFATDEEQLYIGSSLGNLTVLCGVQGVGNGANQTVSAPQKGTGGGPTTPRTVVNFAKIILGGTTWWIPLMQ